QALATAYLAQMNGGPRESTGRELDKPVSTILNSGSHQQLVTAILAGVGGRAGQTEPRTTADPVNTITAKADTAVVTAHLAHLRGNCDARDAETPLHTISAGGQHHGVVTAFLSRQFGNSVGQDLVSPAPTVVAGG